MIYAVDHSNRAAYRSQLDAFRQYDRKPPVHQGAGDFSAAEFETADTVHLLRLDEFGGLKSGLALNPTTKPHLLSVLLAGSAAKATAPASDSIYEFTHYFAARDGAHARRERRVCGELLVAMFEYGLSVGLSEISVWGDAFLLQTALELDWRVLPLGPFMASFRGTGIPLLLEVSLRAADSTREAHGIMGPVLTYATVPPPYAANQNQRIRLACFRQ